MKIIRIVKVFFVVGLFLMISQNVLAYSENKPLAQTTGNSDPIIIDHTCTSIEQIPEYWLEQARTLAIHYGHTSHGTQLLTYLSTLENISSTYGYSIFYASRNDENPPDTLDCDPDTLCIYDGNPPETYIMPGDYWELPDGISRTTSVADTNLFNFSMWA